MRSVRIVFLVALGLSCAARAGGPEAPDMGRQMLELVNRARAEHKLGPLAYHDGLAEVARLHSLDMKTHRFFSHESPRTGRVKERVARARIPNRGVGENLARSATVARAHEALMRSAKHRANVLNPGYSHLGVAFVPDGEGLLLCTQVFMYAPPVYDVAKLRREIAEKINQARKARGLRRVLEDEKLTDQARRHSERAASLGRADPQWLEREFLSRDRRWRIQQSAFFLTEDVASVVGSDVAMSNRPTHFGVGVVQSPLASKAAGALWVTLICSQKK